MQAVLKTPLYLIQLSRLNGESETVFFFLLQLFRRVAAALPGMESTQDKSREDSILYIYTLTLKYFLLRIVCFLNSNRFSDWHKTGKASRTAGQRRRLFMLKAEALFCAVSFVDALQMLPSALAASPDILQMHRPPGRSRTLPVRQPRFRGYCRPTQMTLNLKAQRLCERFCFFYRLFPLFLHLLWCFRSHSKHFVKCRLCLCFCVCRDPRSVLCQLK